MANGKKKVSIIHKITAIILILSGLVLLAQLGFIFTRSDADLIQLIKASSKSERDHTNFPSHMRPLSDEEIDQKVESKKEELLANTKGRLSPFLMKGVAGILMLAIAIGLLLNRRSPTRVLAIISVILLAIAMLSAFKNVKQNLDMYKYVKDTSVSMVYFLDLAMLITIPLAALSCLIVMVKPPPKRES